MKRARQTIWRKFQATQIAAENREVEPVLANGVYASRRI